MKIKLKYSKLQIALEILSLLILAATFLYVLLSWGDIPDQIPAHYNFAGEVDRWGSKNEILFLPFMEVGLYLLLTIVGFFPSIWNVPVTITIQNEQPVYQCIKNMLLVLKVEILLIFSYLSYHGIEGGPLPSIFLPVFLVSVFGTTIFFIVRVFRISKRYNNRVI